MRNLWVVILFILLLIRINTANPGVPTPYDFRLSIPRGSVALPQLKNRGLVAEFMDPGNAGLGKSLAYLIWCEVLTAIKEGAVILAYQPGEQPLVDLLRNDYHFAAIEVAKYQRSPMVLWGGVHEEGSRVFIYSYLTLLPEVHGSELSIRLSLNQKPLPGFVAEIPRSRFNFALVETNRLELFSRPLVTYNTKTTLRAGPSETAPSIENVPYGTVLGAIGMNGAWFEVRRPNGVIAYIKAEEQVGVPPRQIEASSKDIELREGPGRDSKVKDKTNLKGIFQVLDMRDRPKPGPWYYLNIGSLDGWVEDSQVRPRFSLPAVYFMAGLYAYRSGDFETAHRKFSQFIDVSSVKESNANLATAYQLKGASSLMESTMKSKRELTISDVKPFSEAISLTPYDPAAYNLRALAYLGITKRVNETLHDLERALQLDRFNERACYLVRNLRDVVDGRAPPYTGLEISEGDRSYLSRIQEKFGILSR